MSAPNVAAVLPSAASALVLQERAIPSPGPNELLVRNHAIAINPIDWKRQAFDIAVPSYPTVLGSDIAGVVVAVGSAVTSFAPGDRILAAAAAMHTGNPDHGAFQTYTLVSPTAATKLPPTLSFPQAATLPTAISTAAIALFHTLNLPLPGPHLTTPAAQPPVPPATGLLVWGGASSAGSAAIQLARLAGLRVFATASPRHHAAVRALGASAVADYRDPHAAVGELLAAARRAGVAITLAVDAVSTEQTLPFVVRVLGAAREARVAHLLPWPEGVARPDGVWAGRVNALEVWGERQDLAAAVFNGLLGGWLESGEVVPASVRVLEGGLGALQGGLEVLRGGVSWEKLVVEVPV